MSELSRLITLGVASSHLTLLLLKSTLLEKPRRFLSRLPLLKRLLECPMCLGVWVALALWKLPYLPEVLAIMGIAHIIYLVRDKFLPCPACEGQQTAYKVTK
jgi:hypothetical protein